MNKELDEGKARKDRWKGLGSSAGTVLPSVALGQACTNPIHCGFPGRLREATFRKKNSTEIKCKRENWKINKSDARWCLKKSTTAQGKVGLGSDWGS
jgi:hypothetical protein